MSSSSHAYLTAVTTTPGLSTGVQPAPGIRVRSVSGAHGYNVAVIEAHNDPALPDAALVALTIEYLASDQNTWTDVTVRKDLFDATLAQTELVRANR